MRTSEKLLILDTETCNTVEEPIPYDIGWAICDRRGNILKQRSYIVEEVFYGMADVMTSAYYAEKIPMYENDIKAGTRKVAKMWDIRKKMKEDIQTYNVKKIGAYNMAFDKRALNNLIRYVSKSWLRWWFPFGMEYICIWHEACQVLLNTKSYIEFCLKNGLVSDKDNILTSAETAYRFITKNLEFAESHTGLEDVKIEIEIMVQCYRQHKKMNKGINPSCWRIVQKKRKELENRKGARKKSA